MAGRWTSLVVGWAAAAAVVAVAGGQPPTTVPAAPASADAPEAYTAAVRRAAEADVAVVQARQQAIRESTSTKAYADAAAGLDEAATKYGDKRNPVVAALAADGSDPRYKTLKEQVDKKEDEIAAARQNPATTADQWTALYRDLAARRQDVRAAEDDAVHRANLDGLRQQWDAASQQFAAARRKAAADAEASEKVKAAVAAATVARAAVVAARPADANAAADLPTPDDYLRQYPRDGAGPAGAASPPDPTPAKAEKK